MIAGIKLEIILDGIGLKEAIIVPAGRGIKVSGDIISPGNYFCSTIEDIEKMISKKIRKEYNGIKRTVTRKKYHP